MNITTIITFVGVIATFVAIYITIRLAKKNKSITKLEIRDRGFFSIHRGEENLNLNMTYKGNKVSKPLIIFNAILENTGNTDIDKNSIHKPLKLKTSQKYKWLEVDLSQNSKVKPKLESITDNEISFKWDLLKKNESLSFKALIEKQTIDGQDNDFFDFEDFYNSLDIDFRITDLDHIEWNFWNNKVRDPLAKSLATLFIVFGIFSLALFSLMYFNPQYFKSSKDFLDIFYEIENKQDNTTFISSIKPFTENEMILEHDTGEKQTVQEDKFNQIYSVKSIRVVEKTGFYIYI